MTVTTKVLFLEP